MSASQRFYNVQYGTVCNTYVLCVIMFEWFILLMRKYFFRHIAEESERKLEMSSMELHKEIQGDITGKLYFICTLLSTYVLISKYSEEI